MFTWSLAVHSLGLLGLALALGVWSYAYAEARRTGRKVAAVWSVAPYTWLLDVAVLAVLVALTVTETRAWARLWWGVCLGLLLWQLGQHLRPVAQEPECPPGS